MIKRLQTLPPGPRIVIFVLMFGGGLFLIAAITVFLVLSSLNSADRQVATAVMDGITVNEFVQLPDDDSYPASIAAAPDGTIYTGSYKSGAVWSISPEGDITELPFTRENVGAVTGLTVAPDGTLYILDRLVFNPRSAGGTLWQFTPNGQLLQYAEALDSSTTFVSPDDIVLDDAGSLYVTDRGRREIWRFTAPNTGDIWWVGASDENGTDVLPTGLAYDPTTQSLILTDTESDTIYRIALEDQSTHILYQYNGSEEGEPGFDGVTVSEDGTIYLAAFASRELMRLTDGEVVTLAAGFRGVSDVVYVDGTIYATNFDSRGLVLPGIQPQLPFALDVITLP